MSHELCHEQNEPSAIWTIITTDNKTPIAECYSATKRRIYPNEVKSISQGEITIEFSAPQSGTAYII